MRNLAAFDVVYLEHNFSKLCAINTTHRCVKIEDTEEQN